MKEVRIMRSLHHTNVVSLVGVVLVDHPLYILLEYVSGSALDVYLKRKHSKISKSERMAMMIGVATGMDYIHKSNVIHRDLAARNCLYDRNNTVKISDFGLSRPGVSYRMKTAQKMTNKMDGAGKPNRSYPSRFCPATAKEKAARNICLYKLICHRSSLPLSMYCTINFLIFNGMNVLIYEIFSGLGPYEDLRNSVVKKMIVEGKVNKFPTGTPDCVIQFVNEKLWCQDPEKRPDFGSIVKQLELLATTYFEKREEQKSSDTLPSSDARTNATIELDVDEKKQRKKKILDVDKTEATVEETKKSTDISAVKDTANKLLDTIVTTTKELVSKVKTSPEEKSEMSKPFQIDVDSRREKDEASVEIRRKPIFGRRSKLRTKVMGKIQ
ncbi:protein tyrosine kinase [Dictyocaulus viviparus]|uniref:Protein tyrosine kinase n=1 Tax=Dictyocaulus viviparus TaxID=29172 RepID=A0A0D8YFL3_DICVI|nr:protein tyrosine kinase [Dictyocaulus viviparus]